MGGVGMSILDSIDTLKMMGLDQEYQRSSFPSLHAEHDSTIHTFHFVCSISHHYWVLILPWSSSQDTLQIADQACKDLGKEREQP